MGEPRLGIGDDPGQRLLAEANAALDQRNQELFRQNQELNSTISRLTVTIEKLEQRVSEMATQLQRNNDQNAGKNQKDKAEDSPAITVASNPNKKRKTIGKNKSASTVEKANSVEHMATNNSETIPGAATTVISQNWAASSTSSLVDETVHTDENSASDECDIDNVGWTLATNRRIGTDKVSPIQLEFLNNEKKVQIIHMLNELVGTDSYKWMQKRFGSAPKIFCKNAATKEKISEALSQGGVQYNTFADDTDRLKSFIVRGLCCGSDDDNIQLISNALQKHGIQSGYSIKRFITGRQKRADGEINMLYRITVPHLFDEKSMRSIRTIGVFGVMIEKMKSNNIIQCFNCQRYSHTARQCHFAYRCVKCTSQHLPGQCPRNTNVGIPVACINCHENGLQHVGHSANQYNSCLFLRSKFKNDGTLLERPNQAPRNLGQALPGSKATSHGGIAARGATLATSSRPQQPTNNQRTNQNSLQPNTNNVSWAQVAGGRRSDDKMHMMITVFKELLPKLIQIGECLQS